MPDSPDANALSLDECATAEILEQVKQELSTVGRPDIEGAKLPTVYNDAVMALRLCERIDECMSWASKYQALASYARQAKDNQLRAMATRIQARAIRRCGELLSEIETARGSRSDLQPRDGAVPKLTRTEAASEAGLSERQRKTALRIANVSSERFEILVEREVPVTVTALAQYGTRSATILPFAYDKAGKSIEVVIEREVGALMSAWQNACHEARLRFLHKLKSQAGRQG